MGDKESRAHIPMVRERERVRKHIYSMNIKKIMTGTIITWYHPLTTLLCMYLKLSYNERFGHEWLSTDEINSIKSFVYLCDLEGYVLCVWIFFHFLEVHVFLYAYVNLEEEIELWRRAQLSLSVSLLAALQGLSSCIAMPYFSFGHNGNATADYAVNLNCVSDRTHGCGCVVLWSPRYLLVLQKLLVLWRLCHSNDSV